MSLLAAFRRVFGEGVEVVVEGDPPPVECEVVDCRGVDLVEMGEFWICFRHAIPPPVVSGPIRPCVECGSSAATRIEGVPLHPRCRFAHLTRHVSKTQPKGAYARRK